MNLSALSASGALCATMCNTFNSKNKQTNKKCAITSKKKVIMYEGSTARKKYMKAFMPLDNVQMKSTNVHEHPCFCLQNSIQMSVFQVNCSASQLAPISYASTGFSYNGHLFTCQNAFIIQFLSIFEVHVCAKSVTFLSCKKLSRSWWRGPFGKWR